MLVYFLLPLFAMLLAVHAFTEPEGWSASGAWRAFQFFLATIYTVTNIGHFLADLCIPDSRFDQVILMGVLTAIGLLLKWQTWLWWAP
jgi:dipeptide/tripeptide permease